MSRSENMRRIPAKDTRPELLLRRELWSSGLRYRLHMHVAGVRPDLVFPGARVAVFVDGCFWHACPQHMVWPRSNGEFWRAKIMANVERDQKQTQNLVDFDWRVCRIWEHEIENDVAAAASRVEGFVRAGS